MKKKTGKSVVTASFLKYCLFDNVFVSGISSMWNRKRCEMYKWWNWLELNNRTDNKFSFQVSRVVGLSVQNMTRCETFVLKCKFFAKKTLNNRVLWKRLKNASFDVFTERDDTKREFFRWNVLLGNWFFESVMTSAFHASSRSWFKVWRVSVFCFNFWGVVQLSIEKLTQCLNYISESVCDNRFSDSRRLTKSAPNFGNHSLRRSETSRPAPTGIFCACPYS